MNIIIKIKKLKNYIIYLIYNRKHKRIEWKIVQEKYQDLKNSQI